MQCCMEDVLPFLMMMIVECVEVGTMTLVKAAMNNGMSQLVYVVYSNLLGTIVLFPFFAVHNHRYAILGLLGIGLLQPLAYAGINYSSPSLATALGNMLPAYTYLIAIILKMEKLDLKSSSSRAKSLGTIIAISGAFLLTFYKGPEILQRASSDSSDMILMSQPSYWVLGGLILVTTGIISSTWNVLQTATVREHPDEITMVFYVSLFGTIQCATFSLGIERNLNSWVLSPGIEIVAVVFGGVFGSAFRYRVLMWCLHRKGPIYVALFKPISMVIAIIMGIIFLGDTLYSGSLKRVKLKNSYLKGERISVIGAVIIALGFYSVVWGQANEMNNLVVDYISKPNPKTPLLSCENLSEC